MAFNLKKLYQGSPAVITAPSCSVVSYASGGTLAAGTYGYRVAATVNGQTTGPGVETTAVTTGSTSANTVNWVLIPGATAYTVYGRTAGGELQLTTVGATVSSWQDTGSGTPSGAMPAPSNVEATATPGLYVAPAGKTALVQQIIVSNSTASPAQVYLSAVSSAGTGGAANRILSGITVYPDSLKDGPTVINLAQPLSAGDFLSGYVNQSGVVITINGTEIG
jgi:hypothetical protein